MPSWIHVPPLALALTLPLLLAAPGRTLSLGFSTQAACSDNGVVQDQQSGSAQASCSHQVSQGGFLPRQLDAQGTASAVAGFRSVGVDAMAQISQSASIPRPAAVALGADASMQDTLILDASFPDGTPVPGGFFSLDAVATGLMQFTGAPLSNASQAVLDVQIVVGGFTATSQQFLIDPASPAVGIAVPIAAVIPWTRGVAIPVLMQAQLSGDLVLAVDGNVGLEVDFSGSLDWLGIPQVTDDTGTPVASYTALTPEGRSWVVPLPEPAAPALLGPAALALVAGARRRAGRGGFGSPR